MRITFDKVQPNLPAEQNTISHGTAQSDRMSSVRGYALDISGKVMDNKAYEGHGRTAEDVMQQMGAMDVTLMRNYLTVMSNSMSAEDFQKMSKDGFDPASANLGESVTILDHIKAAMIKGGTVIDGYTTDVDMDALRDITGSDSFAKALETQLKKADVPCDKRQAEEIEKAYRKATALTAPDEAAIKYMVENQVAPTIDGFYQAEYSASGDGSRQGRGFYADDVSGYYARKADQVDLKALEPQIRKTIETTDLPVNETTMKEAGWLIEKGIPLTAENLELLDQIQNVEIPVSEELIAKAVASAIADGKAPGQADLASPESNLEKAKRLEEEVSSIEPQAVDQVIAKGKELIIRNLRQEMKGLHKKEKEEPVIVSQADLQDKMLHARTVLARTQLIMTTQANLKLLESGYSIETADLQNLVNRLEQAEQSIQEKLWQTTDAEEITVRQSLYVQTTTVLQEIPFVPVDILGTFSEDDTPVTLERVHSAGTVLKEQLDNAAKSYETMMTAPRADLGDSIRKAFRNVDDILDDLQLDKNELNRRAVRILGYNSMEINLQKIEAVKQTDISLRNVMDKMTPANTLAVIRAGKNPLQMSVKELDEFIDTLPEQKNKKEESLGKFLYKLDQRKEITPKEREACIGVFRLFRQISKKDDAAIGRILQNGEELTFTNLLSALRSERKTNMEYQIDDRFGGVNPVAKNITISEQIETVFYYKQLAEQAVEQATPERILESLATTGSTDNLKLEENTSALEQMIAVLLQENDEISANRIKQEEKEFQLNTLEEIHDASVVAEETIDRLLGLDMTISPQMLLAMEQISEEPAAWFKNLFKKPAREEESEQTIGSENDINEQMEGLAEDFTDALVQGEDDRVRQSYDVMMEQLKSQADEQKELADSFLDLRTLQTGFRQLSLVHKMADFGRYDVPVTIEGEDALIHLTLKHNEEMKGQLDILLETEQFGQMAAKFHMGTGTGYVLCNSQAGMSFLKGKSEALNSLISGEVELLYSAKIAQGDFLDVQKNSSSSDIENRDFSNRQLYHTAGQFIKILQGKV